MGQINFNDVQYACRSLTAIEHALLLQSLKTYAKQFWHPATDYLAKIQDLDKARQNYCLAHYLANLDFDSVPIEIMKKNMDVEFLQCLLSLMCPTFPQELIIEENWGILMEQVHPFFQFSVETH